jgi:exosortase A-associated hydrolase 1
MTMAPPTTIEQPLQFQCDGDAMLGILHRATDACAARSTAVVVVVGGPQYRAGSHRQFVHLARTLAAAGYPVLRFDFRGMGDSAGAPAHFERVSEDIASAVDALVVAVPQVTRIVLWGLCDGASAALLYLDDRKDSRVHGLCLANPWVRGETSFARTTLRHYYAARLLQASFWRKLFGGKVPLRSLGDVTAHALAAAVGRTSAHEEYRARMLRALEWFQGRTLFLLSGQDLTSCEFAGLIRSDTRWTTVTGRSTFTRIDVPAADHTFSSAADRNLVESATLKWLEVD